MKYIKIYRLFIVYWDEFRCRNKYMKWLIIFDSLCTLRWIINDEIKRNVRSIYYSLRENIIYNSEIFICFCSRLEVDFFFKYNQNFHISLKISKFWKNKILKNTVFFSRKDKNVINKILTTYIFSQFIVNINCMY